MHLKIYHTKTAVSKQTAVSRETAVSVSYLLPDGTWSFLQQVPDKWWFRHLTLCRNHAIPADWSAGQLADSRLTRTFAEDIYVFTVLGGLKFPSIFPQISPPFFKFWRGNSAFFENQFGSPGSKRNLYPWSTGLVLASEKLSSNKISANLWHKFCTNAALLQFIFCSHRLF